MTMDWNTYQQQALTTAIYPLKRELEYTVLGLGSEVGELGEAFMTALPDNIHSELGDCFWYAAAIADALKLPLQHIATLRDERIGAENGGFTSTIIFEIIAEASKIQGVVKKAIRDNDGYLSDASTEKIKYHLFRLLWKMDTLCDRLGTSRYAVMNDNLNKLQDRKQRGVLSGSGDNR